MPQKLYRVSWEIEVHADSPEQAAEKALQIQRDPDSIATVFTVTDPAGTKTDVDLNGDDVE